MLFWWYARGSGRSRPQPRQKYIAQMYRPQHAVSAGPQQPPFLSISLPFAVAVWVFARIVVLTHLANSSSLRTPAARSASKVSRHTHLCSLVSESAIAGRAYTLLTLGQSNLFLGSVPLSGSVHGVRSGRSGVANSGTFLGALNHRCFLLVGRHGSDLLTKVLRRRFSNLRLPKTGCIYFFRISSLRRGPHQVGNSFLTRMNCVCNGGGLRGLSMDQLPAS